MKWKIKNVSLSLVAFGITVFSTASIAVQTTLPTKQNVAKPTIAQPTIVQPIIAQPTRVNIPTKVNVPTRKPATLEPRQLHQKPANVKYWKGLRRDRVIVKFMDGFDIDLLPSGKIKSRLVLKSVSEEGLRQLKMTAKNVASELDALNTLIDKQNIKGLDRLFSQDKSTLLKTRVNAEGNSGSIHSHLNNYFWLALNPKQKGEKLGSALNKFKIVEISYLPPIPQAADYPPATPDFEFKQGYLANASNNGIDALSAWNSPGGRGAGMKFIDIEAGWNLRHEDLPAPFFTFGFGGINGNIVGEDDHGTAVLGVLVAKNDGTGMTGIVSDAEFSVVSNVRFGAIAGVFGGTSGIHDMSVADAINVAASHLTIGDVIIIEQHSPGPESPSRCDGINNRCQTGFVPMEFFPATFDAIRQATNNGLIILEAAGNGGVNLDSNIYANRFDKRFVNSGAIMVGASSSTSRTPLNFSNHGSRVDLHAWGESVATTGYGRDTGGRVNGDDRNQFYTSSFSGTSSATPIVAGAVLSIQGMLKADNRNVLNAAQMTDLLQSTGTAQTGTLTRPIGPMPNLRSAIAQANLGTGIVGGRGGRQFRLECDSGQFLVGLKGLSGAYIDKVQAMCSDGSGVLSDTGEVGGNGTFNIIGFSAQSYEIRCATGRAVTGIQGFSGAYIDSMRLECHAINNSGTPSGNRTTTNSVGGNGGNQFGPLRCNNGEIASGITGRAGQFVDDIQLVCSDVAPAVSNVTSANLGPNGGPGGQDFDISCNNGETIVGISVGFGAWVDKIAPRCNRVSNTGQWGNTVVSRNSTGGEGVFGPPSTVNVSCPPNHAVVGYSGKAGSFIDRIVIRCKRLATATTTVANATIVNMEFAGGNGGSNFGPYECPNNLVVSSFFGKSALYIDSLGMRCGN